MSTLHITPIGDLIEHELTEECPCGPQQQLVQHDDAPDGWLIVHHSLDGREQIEVKP